ncbi:MAG TPA: cobalamin-independent methionine synthase II family protein [Stellaceae bacterium]|nr:cobalamin-independent methionine synthase II family protein [Stellaceae bacterium]
MKQSINRILTTHVGSLPRPPDLLSMIEAREAGGPFDAAFDARLREAVGDAVRRQAEAGIDIVGDGEMGRIGFIPYVNERLSGIEARPAETGESHWARSREHRAFPEFYDWVAQLPGTAGKAQRRRWVVTGPIAYKGHDALRRDIDRLKAALAGVPHEEAFMPAVSPANLAQWNHNEYYATEEEYRVALADALNEEYRAVVNSGLLLQIDDPQLASSWVMHPEWSLDECRRHANDSVALLNHALAGIPRDRVRYHTCYSINIGPRVHDLELKHLVDILLRIEAGAYSFEAANPRHEHEWRVWAEVALPADRVLIPGIVTHASNLVEHPELVAERIARFAGVVGRERVIAGADCGFASFATSCEVHPTIVWQKLAALAEGARLASLALWGKA